MQTSIKRIKYSFQELEEDRALLQRRVDEQLQQIAELKSMLDGLKVTSQDTAAYDQVDNEIQRLNVHLESTQSDVDAKNKEVGTNHRYNYYYTYLLCQTMDLSIIFPIFCGPVTAFTRKQFISFFYLISSIHEKLKRIWGIPSTGGTRCDIQELSSSYWQPHVNVDAE